MATYSAQNYGAKKYDRIWLGVRECIKLSLTFAIVVGIILNLFSPILIRAFVGEGHEDVVELGRLFFLTNGTTYSSSHYYLFTVIPYKGWEKHLRQPWLELWNSLCVLLLQWFFQICTALSEQLLPIQWRGLVQWCLS